MLLDDGGGVRGTSLSDKASSVDSSDIDVRRGFASVEEEPPFDNEGGGGPMLFDSGET